MTKKQPVKRGTGRSELITATLRLVADRGLHAVTLREIAAGAGLSLGSTTYHFEDRVTLFRAAFSEYVTDTESLVADAVTALRTQRDVRSGEGMHDAIRTLFSDRRQVLIRSELRLEATRDAALHELHQRCCDAIQTLIAGVLRAEGQAAADRHAVWSALALLDAAALDAASEYRDRNADDFAAAMNDCLVAVLHATSAG